MNPRDFHRLAARLMTDFSPAAARTAISQAYYASYNVAVETLTEMGFRVSRGPAGHGEVQNRLLSSGDTEVMRVGSQLADLHRRRIQADYRLDNVDVERLKTVRALIEQAGKMINILDACRTDPRRNHIIVSIQDWERKVSGQG